MILLKNTSKINKGNNNSNSIRTTIPSSIAQALKLKAGDSLMWKVEVITEDNITVSVSKAE